MTSSKPYLIRALYQWIVDNGMTPQILVQADDDAGHLPKQYVKEGKIILNISPNAVRALEIGDQALSFNARFGGAAMNIVAPVDQVLAIYARENGQGMLFSANDGSAPPEGTPPAQPPGDPKRTSKPRLKVVK